MKRRPVSDLPRSYHSFSGALAVGLTIAAFAICIVLLAGGGRP